jgi:hypothetical protein
MTPFSQRWDFWSRVAFKDGGDDGGGGGSDSGSGKFTVTNPVTGDVTRHSTKAAAEAAASSLASDLGTTVSDLAPSSSPRPTARPDRAAPSPARDNDFGMTTGTPLDTSAGIESLLPPPPPPGPRATDIYDDGGDDFVYQGPTFTGPGYTQDVSQMDVDEDTGFITDDRGVDYTPPPAVAVDEFSGLLPSMTDPYYVPPSVSTSLIGTGDPVLDAISRATTTPTFTYTQPVSPLTNPLGQAPAPSTQDSFSDRALAATQRAVLNTAGGLATGIGSLAEAIAPRSIANVGYGQGEIDPRLAAAVGLFGDRVAVGDPNPVTQGAVRTAESLNAAGDRVFRNMSPEQQANLTDPLYTAEDGINFPALGAQLYQGGISLAPTLGAFFVNPLLGAADGGAQGSGDVADRALERVDNFATLNNTPGINRMPAERSAMESAALETSALYAPLGALSAGIYGSRLPLAGKVATGSAEEAIEEGFVQPSAGETIGRYAIAPDDFRMSDVELQYDPKGATIGAILGGAAAGAVGGGAGRTSGPAPAPTGGRGTAPTPGGLPVAPTTPGVLQIPGTDVVVNTAPVTPMIQAPTLRTPAPLGTSGTFLPGVTQQGAIITPAAPARPALPAPDAQPTADLQTAADIIDAGLERDGGIGSETFQAVDEATGGRLNMMDVQAIMEQRMAERNAAQAFDPDAALARLQARFPGARLAEPTVETAPPAQPAFDPDAALERLRGQFPGIRTVEDTTVAQQAPALPAAPSIDAPPAVGSTTSVARTDEATDQPVQEFVFDGEILGPELDVSTEVVPPQEGVTIDQTIPRDLVVPTQPPVSTEPDLAVEQETSPLVLVSTVDDEPPVEREQPPAAAVDEEEDTGGEGGEDTEVAVEVEPDEDGECPPGFVRRLVDGQYTCVPEEEEVLEEEEEPAFECPPGFRRVQMANGGFTCVPETTRPRVGPFTQTVDVSGLAGRTVFRPGTRSR